MSREWSCNQCRTDYEISEQDLESHLLELCQDDAVHSQVTEFTSEFSLSGFDSDVAGGSGTVTMPLTFDMPVFCEDCETEQSVEFREMRVSVTFSYTNRAEETGTWAIDEIDEIDQIVPAPAGRVSTSIEDSVQEKNDAEERRLEEELFAEMEAEWAEERERLEQLFANFQKDARKATAAAAGSCSSSPSETRAGREWRALLQGSFDCDTVVKWMYHVTWPHRQAGIDHTKKLEAAKANDAYYDKEMTRPGAPRVVFFLVTTMKGNPPTQSVYPLKAAKNTFVPRLNIALDPAYANSQQFVWFFLGYAFPYKRQGSRSQAVTVQVHVLLVAREDENALLFCHDKFVPLDLSDPNNKLLRFRDGRFQHPHRVRLSGEARNPHWLWLNIACFRDVYFEDREHRWDQVWKIGGSS